MQMNSGTSVFYRNKPIIGLDINRTSARAMSIDPTKLLVHGYSSVDLDPEKTKDDSTESSEYLTSRIKELFNSGVIGRIDGRRAVVGIPTAKTFTRTFSLPGAKPQDTKNAVTLEAEQYIPIPPESLYMDHQIINRTSKEMTVLMCAVPKQYIDALLSVAQSVGLDVAVIEPSINAISRLLEVANESGNLPTVIIDINPTGTDIAIFDGAIRLAGSLNIGNNTLTLDIAKHLNIPLENAHQLKSLTGLNAGPRQAKMTAALRPSLMRIVNETTKVMRFYVDRFPEERKLEQVLVVGSGSGIPGLGDFFTNELVMPARVASPWQSLDFGNLTPPAKQLRSQFMTAAGLSLVKPERIWL